MKMKNLACVFGAAVVTLVAVLPRIAEGVEISKVPEGKLAAFSFTYDDSGLPRVVDAQAVRLVC